MMSSEPKPKRAYHKKQRPYTTITPAIQSRVKQLRRSGMKYAKISKIVGIAPSSISDILNHKRNYKKMYSVGDRPSNEKAVYDRHQQRLKDGKLDYLPKHHLCPVCNPHSTTTWKEYFHIVHGATMLNARVKLEQKTHTQEFSMSNM